MDLSGIDMGEIEKIMSSLSQQDMEMLGSMASQFFSSDNSAKEEKDNRQNSKDSDCSKGTGDGFADMQLDFELIKKIASVMNKLNSHPDDSRCRFLMSLKPMLSDARQQKVDSAVSMLRIMSLLPLISELG